MEQKYSQETIKKIKKNAILYKQAKENINSLSEDFFYSSLDIRGVNSPFCPLMAGITHPSRDYFCISSKGGVASHLFVLEYVVSGKGYIEVGGKKYEVKAGDTYLMNCPAPARWYADPDDPYEKKWLNFTGRFANGLMYTYNMVDKVYVAELDSEEIMDEIHEIMKSYDVADPKEDNARLMQLIMGVIGRMNDIFERDKKSEKVNFQQILGYIANNLRYESLSPASICHSFFISERTLTRMFAKNLGISPAKYILLQRTEMGKKMLAETDMTVDRISAILHFSGTRHFRRVFEEYCGMTPSEWRKQNQK